MGAELRRSGRVDGTVGSMAFARACVRVRNRTSAAASEYALSTRVGGFVETPPSRVGLGGARMERRKVEGRGEGGEWTADERDEARVSLEATDDANLDR